MRIDGLMSGGNPGTGQQSYRDALRDQRTNIILGVLSEHTQCHLSGCIVHIQKISAGTRESKKTLESYSQARSQYIARMRNSDSMPLQTALDSGAELH